MPARYTDLTFDPPIEALLSAGSRDQRLIISGKNNSGKSAYLKGTFKSPECLYIGVNRFYSFHYMQLYQDRYQEFNQYHTNTLNHLTSGVNINFEGSFFNCASAVSQLTNSKRSHLFSAFADLFGTKIEVVSELPDNELSNRYISVDGDSLSVTSSGTRLFLGLMAALMDERFTTFAIDEPELGLSPVLQRRLADVILRGKGASTLFPHRPNVIFATHSHLFLDKQNPTNNVVVDRNGSHIKARRLKNVADLHSLTFRLLGNELSDLFLPDFVVFVEGKTDKTFLEHIVRLHRPSLNIVFRDCSGDISRELNQFRRSLGDFQISPYRTRTLLVFDSVKQSGLRRATESAGLADASQIAWEGNGIEFVYPINALSLIFRKQVQFTSELVIQGDTVSVGSDLEYTKAELCERVVRYTDETTPLSPELTSKFLSQLPV